MFRKKSFIEKLERIVNNDLQKESDVFLGAVNDSASEAGSIFACGSPKEINRVLISLLCNLWKNENLKLSIIAAICCLNEDTNGELMERLHDALDIIGRRKKSQKEEDESPQENS